MKRILSLKAATSNPADGIDNFNRSVFGRMDGGVVTFYAEGSVEERGALKKISTSRLQFLRRNTPDIIWGNGHVRDLLFVLLKAKRTAYIINFHTILLKKTEGAWLVRTPWFLRKFLFNRADLIICPSSFSADSVRGYFPHKKIVSVLNGVDLGRFNPRKKNEAYLQRAYGIDFSRPVVAFLGTLQPRKRPDIFIAIAKRCPEANFVAVGRAIPPHDFISSTHGMENFQWIATMPPRDDSATFFASSFAFLFPSLKEPAAAVILEAMASGCVPLLSKSGGNGEFLMDGRSGFLVAPGEGEEERFLVALRGLLSNVALREKMSAATRAEAERHSWDAATEAYKKEILLLSL